MNRPAPTLVIMAAGIGSRYGGLKQIDPIGPTGEIVIDYSVYDALRAGFGDVVFIIRRDIEEDFKAVVEKKMARHIAVSYVFQDIDDLPTGYTVPGERTKPWGTSHAIRAARDAVTRPFAVINADDFYGAEAFVTLCDYLKTVDPASTDYSLVAYVLRNTLSDNGTVTRGVCSIVDGTLSEVNERHDIEAHNGAARYKEAGAWHALSGGEPVSMNIWGFTPTLFAELESRFPAFLDSATGNPKAEFLIPTTVDELIREGAATVHALYSDARWLGVTYPEDKATVAAGIRAMIDDGIYPADLWSEA